MLGKLLKYELPAMGRKLWPLYAAWAVTAIFLGLTSQSAASKSEFMVVISGLLYGAVAVAIMVMAVVMIVQRYSNSLLGDEAYFNQVLPVSAAEHIGNKLISATIWVMVTILVAIVTALLIALAGILVMGIQGTGLEFFGYPEIDLPKHFGLMCIEVFVLVVAGIVKTVMQIYTAITIGHQASNHITLASIGAYILVMMFESIAGRLFIWLFPALADISYGMDTVPGLSMLFIPALIITVCFSAIYFFICKFLMEKRLNLG